MTKNAYFSNIYWSVISKNYIHLLLSLLEHILTLTSQIEVFNEKFGPQNNINNIFFNFNIKLIYLIKCIPNFVVIIIIMLIYISIPLYFFIYDKFQFNKRYLFKIVIINIFEIFIFRILFIIICHIVFSLEGTFLLIFILLLIPILILILNIFFINHLYYFSPHFIIYPSDYYSSYIDIIHLIEKVLISFSFQSKINELSKFLFLLVFLLQIICFIFSLYIFYFKSFFIMNNIFLNKARFSFLLSNLFINLIMVFSGKINIKRNSFLLLMINVYIILFIIIQIYYNPYKFIFFYNDGNKENLYFYFFIIDHIRNESFILEETFERHLSLCHNCGLCNNLKQYIKNKISYKNINNILYKDKGILSKIIN